MNKKIKVLFVTYPHIGLDQGGFQIQIEKTAAELEKLGVEVIFYNPWISQFDNVDICHVFSTSSALVYHVKRAAGLNLPVIITPVTNSFTGNYWLIFIKVLLSRMIPGMYSDIKRIGEMLPISSKVLALNEEEKTQLVNAFGLDPCLLNVVPNGVDPRFSRADPELFKKKYKLKKFVLQVGSIDKNKNQFHLINAMRTLPYTLVIIGPVTPTNYSYLDKCKAIAGDNVIFVGQLKHDDPLFASAYAGAKLFVLPSYKEVMPLSLYEAALSGCKLAVSETVPVSKEIAEFVSVFDPGSPKDIREIIKREMNSPTAVLLREKVNCMPLWADVAYEIREIYNESIKKKRITKKVVVGCSDKT